jgi:hypothetical protein
LRGQGENRASRDHADGYQAQPMEQTDFRRLKQAHLRSGAIDLP